VLVAARSELTHGNIKPRGMEAQVDEGQLEMASRGEAGKGKSNGREKRLAHLNSVLATLCSQESIESGIPSGARSMAHMNPPSPVS
jgi:hypothetical protein